MKKRNRDKRKKIEKTMARMKKRYLDYMNMALFKELIRR